MLEDQALSEGGYLFPLLELPDVVLANVLQRCPPGSIAGFPLPLALAQVRVTGSMDPHWARPLLHLAARSPAVLQRLSRHLRSVGLSSIQDLEAVASHLTALEELNVRGDVPASLLAVLPTGLTKLSVGSVVSLEAHLLSRLTALEALDPGEGTPAVLQTLLPRLRRLKCHRHIPLGLDRMAPNLEELQACVKQLPEARLPRSLTSLELRNYGRTSITAALPAYLAPLTALRRLSIPCASSALPDIVSGLPRLTRLEIQDYTTDNVVPVLAKALTRGGADLGLCLLQAEFQEPGESIRQVLPRLVEARSYLPRETDSLPWAALTRLSRLVLAMDGSQDASWVQALSQLPSLRELDVTLESRVPEGFGALTQCTRLELENIDSTANLSCLQQLTRLRECRFDVRLPVEYLAALPDCLTKLHVLGMKVSPDLPLGDALQHLTALEDLTLRWAEGEDRVYDLSPLKRLTDLCLEGVHCPLIRLGYLPCLRSLILYRCPGLDRSFFRQLENAPNLRELTLDCLESFETVVEANLAPITRLPLLEKVELPSWLCRFPFHVTQVGIERLLGGLPLLQTHWL